MLAEHVTYGAAGDTEESGACQTIQEPRHQHGLNVLSNGAWNHPDQKEGK